MTTLSLMGRFQRETQQMSQAIASSTEGEWDWLKACERCPRYWRGKLLLLGDLRCRTATDWRDLVI